MVALPRQLFVDGFRSYRSVHGHDATSSATATSCSATSSATPTSASGCSAAATATDQRSTDQHYY